MSYFIEVHVCKRLVVIEVGLMVASEESNHWKGQEILRCASNALYIDLESDYMLSSLCKIHKLTFDLCIFLSVCYISNLKVHSM